MDSLSFAQMESRRDTISRAHMNTCKWIFDKQEYLDWRDVAQMSTHHGFFWIKSKPGAGKSTLMKFMVRAARRRMPQDTIISFFFNARGGDRLETSLEGILSKVALCAQQDWPTQSLEALSHDAVLDLDPGQNRLTCFIDALDECPEDDVRAMLKSLGSLSDAALDDDIDLRICFSSRHYPHITFERCQHLILDGQEGHEQDISTYVRNEFVGKGRLIEDMKLEIQRRAQGVFLWAELVVQILNKDCDRGNVQSLQARLDEIPDGLDDLFHDILQRGIQENSHLVQILQWILYAQRPLTPQEMYIAVHSGTFDASHLKPWNSDEIEPLAVHLFILDSSKGLAEMTKGTKRQKSTVQFIHESVRDYLRKTGFGLLAPELVKDLEGATHEYIYRCCSRWMCNDVIKHLLLPDELPKAKSPEAKDLRDNAANLFPFLEYCVSNLVYHAELAHCHGTLQDDFITVFPRSEFLSICNVFAIHNTRRHSALETILAEKNATSFLALDIVSTVFDGMAQSEGQDRQDLEEALRLAKTAGELTKLVPNWNASNYRPMHVLPFKTIELACEGRKVGILRFLNQYYKGELTRSIMAQASRSKDVGLREELLQWLPKFVYYQDAQLRPIIAFTLEQAVLNREDNVVRLILRHLNVRDTWFDAAKLLSEACFRGHTQIVQLFLEACVMAGYAIGCKPTTLIVPARDGHEAIVRLLLSHSAVVKFHHSARCSALEEACLNGHESVVCLLLEPAADRVFDRDRLCLLLYMACKNNYKGITDALLAVSVEVGLKDRVLTDAMSFANSAGEANAARTLRAHGATCNDADQSIRAQLFSACTCSSDDFDAGVFQRLFENVLEVNSLMDELVSWLATLRPAEYDLVVRMLMSSRCTTNMECYDKASLLVSASAQGCENIVQSVLRQGDGIPKEASRKYFDALSWASRNGHQQIVDALLAYDASMELQDADSYRNTVQALTMSRSGGILRSLLDQSNGFRSQSMTTYRGPLRQAIQLGFVEIVQILREKGVTLPEDFSDAVGLQLQVVLPTSNQLSNTPTSTVSSIPSVVNNWLVLPKIDSLLDSTAD
ncbi:hypothetical protein MBLNU13_g09290t1 [Cladosporium sp. NU13]